MTRAARTEIAGVQDDGALKIRLTASPAEGQANKQLLDFLAQRLQVPVESIEIVAGVNSRDKLISVEGIDPRVLEERLATDAAE